MDRFEVHDYFPFCSYLFIYIPVWIDLKAAKSIIKTIVDNHLHSSMDRFEARSIFSQRATIAIYIPVWIDLKLRNSEND